MEFRLGYELKAIVQRSTTVNMDIVSVQELYASIEVCHGLTGQHIFERNTSET